MLCCLGGTQSWESCSPLQAAFLHLWSRGIYWRIEDTECSCPGGRFRVQTWSCAWSSTSFCSQLPMAACSHRQVLRVPRARDIAGMTTDLESLFQSQEGRVWSGKEVAVRWSDKLLGSDCTTCELLAILASHASTVGASDDSPCCGSTSLLIETWEEIQLAWTSTLLIAPSPRSLRRWWGRSDSTAQQWLHLVSAGSRPLNLRSYLGLPNSAGVRQHSRWLAVLQLDYSRGWRPLRLPLKRLVYWSSGLLQAQHQTVRTRVRLDCRAPKR